MPKARINVSLDQDLADFIKVYVKENRLSVSDLVTQFFLAIKRRAIGENTENLMADPAFRDAMDDMRRKLQDGTAQWHKFEDVFGD